MGAKAMNRETKAGLLHDLYVAKANVKHDNWATVIYTLERVLSVAKKAQEAKRDEVV
tara:strand:+ start:2275 stop:2445 length:171 start_codon:yes stop_codon:yes gene_type:complete